MPTDRQPPKDCDVCHSPVLWVIERNSKRDWPYIWNCEKCGALVGCHPGTNIPLGYMANPYVRRLRAELHEIIDPLWRSHFTSRSKVYAWIAFALELEQPFAHVAELTITQLKQAIELCKKEKEAIEFRDLRKANQNSDVQANQRDRKRKLRFNNSRRKRKPY